MPRIDQNVTICGRSENDCIEKVKVEMNSGKNSSLTCNCPYGCHDIKFDMELSSTPIFKDMVYLKRLGLSPGDTSILQVYYQQSTHRSYVMDELVGLTEFLCEFVKENGIFEFSICFFL